jgi:hypothetical protein
MHHTSEGVQCPYGEHPRAETPKVENQTPTTQIAPLMCALSTRQGELL